MTKQQTPEPTLGADYSVIFDHYAEIPMKQGRLITDAPSLLRTRDGALLCAVPIHTTRGEPLHPLRPLQFFRSEDGGATWQRLEVASDFCCGTLFRVGEALYFLGTMPLHRSPSAPIAIIRSEDEGRTWSDLVRLFEGSFYNTSGSSVIKDGTFYFCFDTGRDTTFIVAGDTSGDLLSRDSWRISEGTPMPPIPSGLTRGEGKAQILEGNVVEVNGRLQVNWRCVIDKRDTAGVGIIYDLADDGRQLDYRFRQFHPIPGAWNHFHIVWDEKSKLYWMNANLPTRTQDQDPDFNARLLENPRYSGSSGNERRILALFCSFDALNWLPAGYIVVWPLVRQASNYCGLLIDGDDLLVAARTSREGAHQHDNDITTFHRVQNFRERAAFLHECQESSTQ